MTVMLERNDLWTTRPGWGIAVDLTPGEVVTARKVRSLKKLIAGGLALVLLLCIGAAAMTLLSKAEAQDSYDAAQADTTALQAEAKEYADITAMQATIAQVESQVATLMADDVDFVNLMARIRTALPAGLIVTNESVVLVQEAAPGVPGMTASDGGVIIGTVTIAGSGAAIKDLAPFVANLIKLRGVADVVPTSTTKTDAGMDFTTSFHITDALYTHRFDPAGAK